MALLRATMARPWILIAVALSLGLVATVLNLSGHRTTGRILILASARAARGSRRRARRSPDCAWRGRRAQVRRPSPGRRRAAPDIAAELHIAASTVDVHRRNLMRKLDLHNVVELTRYAIRNGLVMP